jgi:hypothetical protein
MSAGRAAAALAIALDELLRRFPGCAGAIGAVRSAAATLARRIHGSATRGRAWVAAVQKAADAASEALRALAACVAFRPRRDH